MMSWGRLTMILATFVQKCKEKCVWSLASLWLSPKEGVQCTGLGNFTFQSSLSLIYHTDYTLSMNEFEYLHSSVDYLLENTYLLSTYLDSRMECFVLVWSRDCWSHKTNLFSSDIGSDDDDANPTNQSPVYRVQIHSLLYFIVYW